MVLGVWASLTPMRENEWTLLSLFGVGAAGGAVVGFLLVTCLMAGLLPLYAAGWILALLSLFLSGILGCLLGRIVALVAAGLLHRLRAHRAMFAVSLGLFVGLMTGTMFGSVTVGSAALKQPRNLIGRKLAEAGTGLLLGPKMEHRSLLASGAV